jgi:hypothetical protein
MVNIAEAETIRCDTAEKFDFHKKDSFFRGCLHVLE